jgi:hypothetical protein
MVRNRDVLIIVVILLSFSMVFLRHRFTMIVAKLRFRKFVAFLRHASKISSSQIFPSSRTCNLTNMFMTWTEKKRNDIHQK